MNVKTFSGAQINELTARLETAVSAAGAAVVNFIQTHARRILAVLLLLTILMTMFTCMVIGGLGIAPAGQIAPLSAGISGEYATETYGAELFYLQLTAVSGQTSP